MHDYSTDFWKHMIIMLLKLYSIYDVAKLPKDAILKTKLNFCHCVNLIVTPKYQFCEIK